MSEHYNKITPCAKHGAYYCEEPFCKHERLRHDFVSGVDPGDDQDFIDQHKNRWPKYQPQWKNRGMK